MADNSAIEWTDATWNPIRGCTRVSPGCGGPGPHGGCYAEGIAARFSGPGQAYEGLAEMRGHKPRWTGKVAFVEDALMLPLRWRKPRRIFVNSMSDLFHEKVEEDWIDRVFAVMALCPQHSFQVLTKRAGRMRAYMTDPTSRDRVDAAMNDIAPAHWCAREVEDFGGWPLKGVWFGVSVEDQRRADERIPDLLATPAVVRWISAEPLLGPVNLHEYLLGFSAGHPASCACGHGHGFTRCPNYGGVSRTCHRCACTEFRKAPGSDGLSWVVVGGESGPGARPMHPDWARSLREQCAAAGVPYHFKQQGAWAPVPWKLAREPGEADAAYKARSDAGAASHALTVSGDLLKLDHAPWSIDRAPMSPGNGVQGFRLVGKKAAGRLLDGVEHNGFPESGRVGAEGSRRG